MAERYAFNNHELEDFDLSEVNPLVEMDSTLIEAEAIEESLPAHVSVLGFDYSGVSDAVAAEAEQTAQRIRDRLRGSIIETGNDLLAIKVKLGHGKFGEWLKFHFSMSERTAQNFMNAASVFGATPKVIDVLPPSTVYKLAAKSAPVDVRQSVIDEVVAGSLPSQTDVEARIAAAKDAERRMREGERAEQEEALAWNRHEQDLRKAGKSDEEIEVERKRWDTKKALKDRRKEKKLAEEAAEVERARRKAEEWKRQQEDMEGRAVKVAEIFKKRLGDKFEEFRALILKIDFHKFQDALQNA